MFKTLNTNFKIDAIKKTYVKVTLAQGQLINYFTLSRVIKNFAEYRVRKRNQQTSAQYSTITDKRPQVKCAHTSFSRCFHCI